MPHIHPERDQILDLPPRLAPIIGRDDDLNRLSDLLANRGARAITITGPGGVGKTRLAIECAHREVARGIWRRMHFVPFATVSDPAQVLATIATRLGTDADLASTIADAPTLLVLDGIDRVLAAAADLDRLLQATSHLTIVTTCRQALNIPHEVMHEVGCLSTTSHDDAADDPSTAAALFLDRIRWTDAAFTADPRTMPLIERICHQLDGLPLAIELAAARTRLLSLDALLDRLTGQIDILSGGPRDQPAHQRSLRASIAWSYDPLPADVQRLFHALSWFDMAFTDESANILIRAMGDRSSEDETRRRMAMLADRHLLNRLPSDANGAATFRMLATTQTFGRDASRRLDDDQRIQRAHAEGIADLVTRRLTLREDRTIDPAVLPGISRIYPDIERALRWFETHGETDALLQLVITLAPYWTHRFARTDGCRWFERALARVTPATPTLPAPSETLLARAELEFAALLRTSRTGDLDHAQAVVRRSLDRFTRLNDLSGKVAAQNLAGVLQRAQGDLAHAEGSFDIALMLAESWGHPWWNALIRCNLGATMLWQGETREARHHVEEAIRQFGALNDHRGIAFSRHILALIRCIQGDARTAAIIASEGLDHAIAAEARETTIDLIAAAGFIAAAGGAFADAIALLEAADHLANQAAYRMERPERETYEDARRIARRALGPDQVERLIHGAAHVPLDATVDHARSVLAQASAAPMPHPLAQSGSERDVLLQSLTIREHQVLALLVQRYTDREIAETLQISVRTVSRHVSNVFGKLGLHSRRDLVTSAAPQAPHPLREN